MAIVAQEDYTTDSSKNRITLSDKYKHIISNRIESIYNATKSTMMYEYGDGAISMIGRAIKYGFTGNVDDEDILVIRLFESEIPEDPIDAQLLNVASVNTAYLGRNLHLYDVGGYLTFRDLARDERRETVVHAYDDDGSIEQITDYVFSPKEIRTIIHSDDSDEFIGKEFTVTETVDISALRHKFYFKTGSLLPSSDIEMFIYFGDDDNGHLMGRKVIDYTSLEENTEFSVIPDAGEAIISYTAGENITYKFVCATKFSLKSDSGNTHLWCASDIQRWVPKRVSRENYVFISSDYQAYNNEYIAVNTTSGIVTITPPANPKTGYYFSVWDKNNMFGTNKCVIDFEGTKLNGVDDALLNFTGNGDNTRIVYENDTNGWFYHNLW